MNSFWHTIAVSNKLFQTFQMFETSPSLKFLICSGKNFCRKEKFETFELFIVLVIVDREIFRLRKFQTFESLSRMRSSAEVIFALNN